jgi:hypothetical protein
MPRRRNHSTYFPETKSAASKPTNAVYAAFPQNPQKIRSRNSSRGAFRVPARIVLFDFRLSRRRDGPKEFLGKFDGILETDGYTADDHGGGPNLVHAAYWSHVAIHFRKVLELYPRDRLATPIVELIGELFAVDSEARQRGLSFKAPPNAAPQKRETAPRCDSQADRNRPSYGAAGLWSGQGLQNTLCVYERSSLVSWNIRNSNGAIIRPRTRCVL